MEKEKSNHKDLSKLGRSLLYIYNFGYFVGQNKNQMYINPFSQDDLNKHNAYSMGFLAARREAKSNGN